VIDSFRPTCNLQSTVDSSQSTVCAACWLRPVLRSYLWLPSLGGLASLREVISDVSCAKAQSRQVLSLHAEVDRMLDALIRKLKSKLAPV